MTATLPDVHAELSKVPDHLQPPHQSWPSQPAPSPTAREHQFHIDWTDPTGHRWHGDFACIVPSIAQEIEIGRRVARILGDVRIDQVDEGTAIMAKAIARLGVVLTRKPKWAENIAEHLYDEPLAYILKEVTEHSDRFRSGRKSP